MSDRPSDQDPSENSTKAGSNGASSRQTTSPSTDLTTHRSLPGFRSVTSPTAQRQRENPARSYELPPIPSVPSAARESFSPSTSRIAGVSSILNPPHIDEPYSSRRRKASQLESPALSAQSLPRILPGPHAHQPELSRSAHSPASQYAAPRRILTPRSPSLHRAASLGQMYQPSGTISAQANPLPTSPRGRAYAVEPGTSGAPPLPALPAGAKPAHGFSAPTSSAEATRMASAGAARARGLSLSASPSTSYSSHSQHGQTSPAGHYERMSLATLSASYVTANEAGISGSGTASAPPTSIGVERQRHMGIPISSSGGQNVYQMLTLETTSGTVQLPVDVQAASRVADEKRRRNAGASARFRQRRKEKEKEATTSIARLEQQAKDLNEDAEFYRRERDFLAGILAHIPGGERHFPRPTSPRLRRPSLPPLSGSIGSESAYGPAQEQMTRSPDEGRNVRRRTSTFSLPPPPPLPTPGVPIQPNFGQMPHQSSLQSPSGPLPSPLTRMPLPPPSQMPQGQPLHQQPGPPQVLQTMPQTGPWNPYASERMQSGPHNQQREGP